MSDWIEAAKVKTIFRICKSIDISQVLNIKHMILELNNGAKLTSEQAKVLVEHIEYMRIEAASPEKDRLDKAKAAVIDRFLNDNFTSE